MRTKLWGGLSALASIAVGMGAANAADVRVPVYKVPSPVILSDWAGFYLGVHGGYGFGDSSFLANVSANNGPDVPTTVGVKPKGGLGGGHIGYNWQFGSVVVGLEGDFDGAAINGSNTSFSNTVPSLKTDELASARGRLGYAVLPDLLAYGTGGFGWAHSVFNGGAGAGFNGDESLSQIGWTAGAGLEYKYSGDWMVRVEYLHYSFGDKTLSDVANIKEDLNVVRAGIGYKF